MSERVGFIGLGVMGRPMAARLAANGYPLVVRNRSQGAVDALVAAGATAAGSPADVARHSTVVITMLPDTPDVEQVVTGEGGLLPWLRRGSLLVDMSTITPAGSRRVAEACAEHGVATLDAPVSGGESGAIDGTLSIMVGGAADDVDRARPAFEELGRAVVHIGDTGAGQIAKAANQAVVAISIQAVAEALTLARKADVDPAKVREALLGGLAQSRVLDTHGQRMIDRAFEPGFRIELHRKDLGIALQTAGETGTPLPLTAQVAQLMNGLDAMGQGAADHSALVLVEEKLADL
ncbi:MAG: 2-hydroxy-3-oxopropionate reductase [Nocardioidaceae bacterium]